MWTVALCSSIRSGGVRSSPIGRRQGTGAELRTDVRADHIHDEVVPGS